MWPKCNVNPVGVTPFDARTLSLAIILDNPVLLDDEVELQGRSCSRRIGENRSVSKETRKSLHLKFSLEDARRRIRTDSGKGHDAGLPANRSFDIQYGQVGLVHPLAVVLVGQFARLSSIHLSLNIQWGINVGLARKA